MSIHIFPLDNCAYRYVQLFFFAINIYKFIPFRFFSIKAPLYLIFLLLVLLAKNCSRVFPIMQDRYIFCKRRYYTIKKCELNARLSVLHFSPTIALTSNVN